MADELDALTALAHGGTPALLVAGLCWAVFKGPSLLRSLSKEYKDDDGKERRRVDADRDRIAAWQEKEVDRLRLREQAHSDQIEHLRERIDQLMRALAVWREIAREIRHKANGLLQQHVMYEVKGGLVPLELEDLDHVPDIAEQRDGWRDD